LLSNFNLYNYDAGKVIGHGGETINSIQTKTGAHVRIQPSSEVAQGAPRRISVSGAPGAVADAVRIIEVGKYS
jgi:far upstream element-binding protein